jgi:Zn-dependent protease with chaperone function
MGIGVSVFLIAVGAILAFAVNMDAEGVDLDTVGVILMIVGAIGLLASLLFWSSYSPWGRREEVVYRDREIL